MPDIIFQELSRFLFILALMGMVLSCTKGRKQLRSGWRSVLILFIIAVNALVIGLNASAPVIYQSTKLLISPVLLVAVLNSPLARQEKRQFLYQTIPFLCFLGISATSVAQWFNSESLMAMLLLIQFWTLAFFFRSYAEPHNERAVAISQTLFSFFLLLLTSLFIINGLFSLNLADWYLDLSLIFLMSCLLSQILSFKVKLSPLLPSEHESNTKYLHSGLARSNTNQEIRKLNQYLSQSKVYKTADLKLKDLSEIMGVSTHHLSQIINTGTDKTFYEYINEFRVAEARKMLKDSRFEYLSTEGIASEAGFKNKNTYHNYFKKYTGTTPAKYRKAHRS